MFVKVRWIWCGVRWRESRVEKGKFRHQIRSFVSEMVERAGFDVMTVDHAWRNSLDSFFFCFSPTSFTSFLSVFGYYLSFHSIHTHTPLYAPFFIRTTWMMRTFSNLFYYNIIKQNTFEWCLISVLFFPFFGAIRFGISGSQLILFAKPPGSLQTRSLMLSTFN